MKTSLSIKVIHSTVDKLDNNGVTSIVESAKILGGREAGICYMAEDYFSNKINDNKSALSRANTIISTGHHSPFDHYSIGLEISNIPKILAMILNSVEMYTTSEKSARYTVMKPETELELNIYNKWSAIFNKLIAEKYPNIDEKTRSKLSLENARYMISVFTPTSMGYTISFRQMSYMVDYFRTLINNLKNNKTDFNMKLLPYCEDIMEHFMTLTSEVIPNTKHREFEFMRLQNGKSPWNGIEYIYDGYCTSYTMSFACLAQAQRHRTIHYEMEFDGSTDYGCYVPPILDDKLKDDWVHDYNSIKDKFPQCTLVKVIEIGKVVDFLYKSAERLCGRAQLEIANRTADYMVKLIENKHNMSKSLQDSIDKYTINNQVCAKCKMNGFKCTEPCTWGSVNALNRLI